MEKIIDNIEEFLQSSTPNRYALTHNGVFHCDEVFAAVIIDELMHNNLTLIRVAEVPTNVPLKNLIIFDIGGGTFDHHQLNSPVRRTGIKYSAAGLIWKTFGRKLLKRKGVPLNSVNYVWNKIDQDFIQAIDASDNGELKSSFPNFCVSKVISNFNPIWDFEEESNDCFMKAFQIAKIIFDNQVEKEMAVARAKESIEKAIASSKDGIMILPKYIPWDDYFKSSKNPERKNIKYVIFKNNIRDNCYCVKATQYAKNRLFPIEWAGLTKADLINVTNIKTATFCHPKRYICAAQSLEDAIKLAKLALNS